MEPAGSRSRAHSDGKDKTVAVEQPGNRVLVNGFHPLNTYVTLKLLLKGKKLDPVLSPCGGVAPVELG